MRMRFCFEISHRRDSFNLELIGNASTLPEFLAALGDSEYGVKLLNGSHRPEENGPVQCFLQASNGSEPNWEPIKQNGERFAVNLAWNQGDSEEFADQAYAEGFAAVLPARMTPAMLWGVLRALSGTKAGCGAAGTNMERRLPERRTPERRTRRFDRGACLFVEQDAVLEILQGAVRCTTIYEDGTEALLGFLGPGDVLLGHHPEHCQVEMTVHNPARIAFEQWTEAVLRPGFNQQLKTRICQMESWIAVQAQQNLKERLLGTLLLIAKKFGKPSEKGWLLYLKVTHEQLAAVVGATRTTVTRLMGDLRDEGTIRPARLGGREIYWVCDREEAFAY